MNSVQEIKESDQHILDRAAWYSLSGPHAHLAEIHGLARRYPTDISPFNAVADESNSQAWSDLHQLIGDDGFAIVVAQDFTVPNGWKIEQKFPGVQMSGEKVIGVSDPDLIPLTTADVPEMLDLIARAQPGPFLPRTIELGGYLGIRVDGKLVAMAGRRLNPPGWVEISAVCTDEEHRGKGYAARLVLAVAAGIQESGQVPFLHTSGTNVNAIRLYEKLGFNIRVRGEFNILKPARLY